MKEQKEELVGWRKKLKECKKNLVGWRKKLKECKKNLVGWIKNLKKWFTVTILIRFLILLLLGGVGSRLNWWFSTTNALHCIFPGVSGVSDGSGGSGVRDYILILAIGLPAFLGLWWFRTIDTRENIRIGQEQISRGILAAAQEAIFSQNPARMRFGFTQLLNLREKKLFVEDVEHVLQSKKEGKIDLSGIDLSGKDLRGFYLANADLQDAQFDKGTDLKDADLTNADLQNTIGFKLAKNIKNAILIQAKLQELDLQELDLQGAKLQGAQLRDAQLQSAQLQSAQLRGAKLQDAQLQGAQFDKGTDLEDADLTNTDLQNTIGFKLAKNIKSAILIQAKLQDLDLQKLDLQGANLQRAQLLSCKVLSCKVLSCKS